MMMLMLICSPLQRFSYILCTQRSRVLDFKDNENLRVQDGSFNPLLGGPLETKGANGDGHWEPFRDHNARALRLPASGKHERPTTWHLLLLDAVVCSRRALRQLQRHRLARAVGFKSPFRGPRTGDAGSGRGGEVL